MKSMGFQSYSTCRHRQLNSKLRWLYYKKYYNYGGVVFEVGTPSGPSDSNSRIHWSFEVSWAWDEQIQKDTETPEVIGGGQQDTEAGGEKAACLIEKRGDCEEGLGMSNIEGAQEEIV